MPRIKLPKSDTTPRVLPSGKQAKTPTASRPYMPGYGISVSKKGMLPWSWAEERLVKTRIYWLTTITPKGDPHVMPIWGIWSAHRFYFSTQANSAKVRNLAANPKCVIATENAIEAVMVQGTAQRMDNAAHIVELILAYKAKYDWSLDPSLVPVFEMVPTVAFAQPHDQYLQATTRWRF